MRKYHAWGTALSFAKRLIASLRGQHRNTAAKRDKLNQLDAASKHLLRDIGLADDAAAKRHCRNG